MRHYAIIMANQWYVILNDKGTNIIIPWNFCQIHLFWTKNTQISWGQHGAHLGLSTPDEPHVGLMNLAIRVCILFNISSAGSQPSSFREKSTYDPSILRLTELNSFRFGHINVISSGNYLLYVRHQAISCTNTPFCQWDPREKLRWNSYQNTILLSRNCIWKCRLQNERYIVGGKLSDRCGTTSTQTWSTEQCKYWEFFHYLLYDTWQPPPEHAQRPTATTNQPHHHCHKLINQHTPQNLPLPANPANYQESLLLIWINFIPSVDK